MLDCPNPSSTSTIDDDVVAIRILYRRRRRYMYVDIRYDRRDTKTMNESIHVIRLTMPVRVFVDELLPIINDRALFDNIHLSNNTSISGIMLKIRLYSFASIDYAWLVIIN